MKEWPGCICPNSTLLSYVQLPNSANNRIVSIRELRKGVWPLTFLNIEGNLIKEIAPVASTKTRKEMGTVCIESLKERQTVQDYQYVFKCYFRTSFLCTHAMSRHKKLNGHRLTETSIGQEDFEDLIISVDAHLFSFLDYLPTVKDKSVYAMG